jgi:hypothetical protein
MPAESSALIADNGHEICVEVGMGEVAAWAECLDGTRFVVVRLKV